MLNSQAGVCDGRLGIDPDPDRCCYYDKVDPGLENPITRVAGLPAGREADGERQSSQKFRDTGKGRQQ